MTGEDANIIAARSRQVLGAAASQIDAAVDRLAGFLEHKSALNGIGTNLAYQEKSHPESTVIINQRLLAGVRIR